MKRFVILFLLCLALFVASPTGRQADDIVVITRNLYLGADLAPVLAATTPQAFAAAVQVALTGIATRNFPERADAFAREVAERRPHLIGLQEVFDFTLNGEHPGAPYRDHLVDVQAALAARGLEYDVVGEVRNLDIAIPFPSGVVRAVDRDVVLARRDVAAASIPVPGCRVSGDGCNFTVVAPITTPFGPIPLERGFLVVDATIGTQHVRFVNTHLEIPELPVVLQAAQAAELIGRVASLANPLGARMVIAGDINSAPTDEPSLFNGQVVVPPYQQFALAGYLDAWIMRPGRAPGFTCCQSSTLLNDESELFKRVDVILLGGSVDEAHANLLGDSPEDRTPSGFWPSDHAGVVARLRFAADR